MDLNETLLPGVGVRYEFVTRSGSRVGVLTHRDGHADLVVYDADDPDACRGMLSLTRAEAEGLAELLGAPRIASRIADVTREVPGLASAKVPVPAGSPFAGRTLGDTRARAATGASVVAVVRGHEVIASPAPGEQLLADDVLVVIGTQDGIAGVRALLQPTGG